MAKTVSAIVARWKDFRAARRPDPLSIEEYFAKLKEKGLNPDGTQVLDPVPMAPPIGYKKHPSMVEIVRDMVRSEKLAQEALAAGHETFEESEDFDVDDDGPLMRSPWENDHDPSIDELLAAGRQALAARQAAAGESGGEGGSPPSEGAQSAPKPKPKAATRAPVPDAPEEP